MKNHQFVNDKLLQTNKKFTHLKRKQKEQISQWLYEEYRSSSITNGQSMAGENDTSIIAAVMEKITDAGIWIPENEIVAYYRSKKPHYQKRFAKGNDCLIEMLEPPKLGGSNILLLNSLKYFTAEQFADLPSS